MTEDQFGAVFPGDNYIERLNARIAELEVANKKLYDDMMKWRKAFHSVTPGGSEYMAPEACVEFIQQDRICRHELIVKQGKENKELREALKPFGEAAKNFDTMPIHDPENWFVYGGQTSIKGNIWVISVGDLRRAAKAGEK